MDFNEWIYFSIYVGAGIIVGTLIQKFLTPVLNRFSTRTQWKTDDLLIDAASKWIVPWLTVFGAYLGWEHVKMGKEYHTVIERCIFVFYSFSVTWIVARVLSRLVSLPSQQTDGAIPSSSIISNILKVLVYCIGILFILQHFDISITPILTALGVGGIAVALALQDTLSNLFAGVQLISTKKIRQGDQVRLESGQDGLVSDISWRYTTIRTGDGNDILIPNAKLAGLTILNFSTPQKAIVFSVSVGVDYNSDLEKVEKATIDEIKLLQQQMNQCVKDFEPFIRFQQFGDSSIDLKAYVKVNDNGSQAIVRHELIKRIKKRYESEGINIPYPVRTVHIQNNEN